MMKTMLFAFGLALALAAQPVAAQDGWRALGEMLGGSGKAREERAFRDQYLRNMEVQAAMRAAAAAEQQARIAAADGEVTQAEVETRQVLTGFWMQLGLSPEESTALASAFVLDGSQAAHNARALQDGSRPTMDAAIEAYHGRQYLLANQLLVASYRAHLAGD